MTDIKQSKVVFVDGPNGVGKNYFIDKFKEEYLLKYPNDTVRILEAKKYMPDHIANNRFYSNNSILTEEVQSVFLAHVELFVAIRLYLDKYDLLLINRSFLSFLVYNCRLGTSQESNRTRYYIGHYLDLFRRYMHGHTSVMVNLTVDTSVSDLESRLLNRNDGIEIDINHLQHLIEAFKKTERVSKILYDKYVETTSDGYPEVLKLLDN